MQLKIVSPEKILFVGEVRSVVVPGSIGMFEILENHAPIISSLEKGSDLQVGRRRSNQLGDSRRLCRGAKE